MYGILKDFSIPIVKKKFPIKTNTNYKEQSSEDQKTGVQKCVRLRNFWHTQRIDVSTVCCVNHLPSPD